MDDVTRDYIDSLEVVSKNSGIRWNLYEVAENDKKNL